MLWKGPTVLLDDPAYEPKEQPVDGVVPDVVIKWGPRSQVRWFHRFRKQLKPMPHAGWAHYYCESVQHRGLCCISCVEDVEGGYLDWDLPKDWMRPAGDERCCCYALHDDGETQ